MDEPEFGALEGVMSRKPISVQVVEEGSARVVVRTYKDGEVTRTPVDPTKKPTRTPRLRVQRLGVRDYTRKKQI